MDSDVVLLWALPYLSSLSFIIQSGSLLLIGWTVNVVSRVVSDDCSTPHISRKSDSILCVHSCL